MEGFSKQLGNLNKLAGFITTVTIIIGAYAFYRTSIW